MYSLGIDTHKSYSQINIIQEDGKIANRFKVNNDRNNIKRVLTPYTQNGARAVLESSCNWGFLYDMLSDDNL